jgi:hypothetical protein
MATVCARPFFEPNHRGKLALGEFLVEDVGSSPVRMFLQLCVGVPWLAILFEQNTGKNAFDQGADVQPLVCGALKTTVVKVVAVDIDTRS